jgi:hypothetical protein
MLAKVMNTCYHHCRSVQSAAKEMRITIVKPPSRKMVVEDRHAVVVVVGGGG